MSGNQVRDFGVTGSSVGMRWSVFVHGCYASLFFIYGSAMRCRTTLMIRFFDVFFAALGLLLGFPLLLLVWLICLFDTGSPMFFQRRIGRNQKIFTLAKFRTMLPGTVEVATHLAPEEAITRWGLLLRKSRIDELPQLWNVFKGDMSLVGPRPCLPSQTELLQYREALGVHKVRPGITGLGQICWVDMSSPQLLARLDAHMIRNMTVRKYFYYIFLTFVGRRRASRACAPNLDENA